MFSQRCDTPFVTQIAVCPHCVMAIPAHEMVEHFTSAHGIEASPFSLSMQCLQQNLPNFPRQVSPSLIRHSCQDRQQSDPVRQIGNQESSRCTIPSSTIFSVSPTPIPYAVAIPTLMSFPRASVPNLSLPVDSVSRPHGHVFPYLGNHSHRIESDIHSINTRYLSFETQGVCKCIIQTFPTSRYDSTKAASLSEDVKKCSICFEDFQHDDLQKRLPCTHPFHEHCIDKWLTCSKKCPICNFIITC